MNQPTLSNAPASLRAEPDAVIGEKYKIARLLGEGGMGAVYEAENTWTRRRVAVKLMRPEFAASPEAVQRFLREAQSAAQIDHPNVVSVLDMGRDAATGSLFIVQEFLVGQDLAAYLEEHGAVSPDDAMELVLPVIDGLAAAHALGVVHRDLKPENIFLVRGRGGRVVPKIIDFGIAKALRPREHEFRTVIGQTMGTPAYMSPEQARGELDIDARTDVWAMGVVLFQLLSGQLPFDYDDNPQVMLAHVITQEPRSLDAIAPSLPADLRSVVNLALTRDRAKRLPDMPTFYIALTATSVGSKVRDTLRRNAPVELPANAPPPVSAPPAPAAPQPAIPAPSASSLDSLPTSPAMRAEAPVIAQTAPEPIARPSRAPKILVGVVALLAVVAIATFALLSSSARGPQPSVQPPSTPIAQQQPSAQPPSAPIARPQPSTQPPSTPVAQQQPPAQAQTPTAGEPPRDRRPTRRPREPSQRGANGAAIID